MGKKVSRDLPVPMEDGELLAKGSTLAGALEEVRQEKETEDGRRKMWNGERKERLTEIDTLASELRNGKVMVPVECDTFIDAEGRFTVKRLDTDEIIETRTPTEDEKQQDLGL